jgi:hypothetical protein
MSAGLSAGIVDVLGHLWNAIKCRCTSDCAYNEVLVPECSRTSHCSIMSAVTKSTDPRYAGRSYIDDPEVYAARVAYAQTLIAEGQSHKSAWYHAFQQFPRTYIDAPTAPARNSDPGNFVFPPGLGPDARCSQSDSN